MSTLKVNDIVEATSGGGKIWPSRAWARYGTEGGTTLNDSENVSSITDEEIGRTAINFSNQPPNANYCAPSAAGDATKGAARIALIFDEAKVFTSYYRVTTDNTGSTNTDADYISTCAIWTGT